jgi:hypothetical protein
MAGADGTPNNPPQPAQDDSMPFFPPLVTWATERGFLRVRDPWGEWHEIAAKDAPRGWVRLAMAHKASRQARP